MEVVTHRDRQHTERLTRTIERHLPDRSAHREVHRATRGRHEHRLLDAFRIRRGDLADDRTAQRVADERRLARRRPRRSTTTPPSRVPADRGHARAACCVPSPADRERMCETGASASPPSVPGRYRKSRSRARAPSPARRRRRRDIRGGTADTRRRSAIRSGVKWNPSVPCLHVRGHGSPAGLRSRLRRAPHHGHDRRHRRSRGAASPRR